jgi:hypothetical protein
MYGGSPFLVVLVRVLVIVIELDLFELDYGLRTRTRRPETLLPGCASFPSTSLPSELHRFDHETHE